MARAINSEVAFRFLTEQLVKETGAFSKGVNKGLNIARSAMRNPDAIPTLTPPNEPEYREYTCPNCHHTWLEDRDASDYPEYCPGCGDPLHKEENEPLTLEQLRESPHGKIKDSTLESICNRANEIASRPPEGER